MEQQITQVGDVRLTLHPQVDDTCARETCQGHVQQLCPASQHELACREARSQATVVGERFGEGGGAPSMPCLRLQAAAR